jgi:hypothetical protein
MMPPLMLLGIGTLGSRWFTLRAELRAIERFRPLQLLALTSMFAALALLCFKLTLFVLGAETV